MKRIKGLIFDLDGVLADSESLANQIEVDIKTEMGFPITLEEQINRFTGMAMNDPVLVEELKRLPENYWDLVDAQKEIQFRERLTTTPGVLEALEQIQIPMSIASNSEIYWLEMKVQKLGLDSFFQDMYFSRQLVEKGKPAPDLFLLASSKMGVNPEDCLVVEDSVHGVTAARAAGMTVCGFLGATHVTEAYASKLKSSEPDFIVEKNLTELFDLSVSLG